jgi:hypothetical protein
MLPLQVRPLQHGFVVQVPPAFLQQAPFWQDSTPGTQIVTPQQTDPAALQIGGGPGQQVSVPVQGGWQVPGRAQTPLVQVRPLQHGFVVQVPPAFLQQAPFWQDSTPGTQIVLPQALWASAGVGATIVRSSAPAPAAPAVARPARRITSRREKSSETVSKSRAASPPRRCASSVVGS